MSNFEALSMDDPSAQTKGSRTQAGSSSRAGGGGGGSGGGSGGVMSTSMSQIGTGSVDGSLTAAARSRRGRGGDDVSVSSRDTRNTREDLLAEDSAASAAAASRPSYRLLPRDSSDAPSSDTGDVPPPRTDVELPAHACAYCGVYAPACVVRCVRTGKWFCNGRGSSSASHAVQHLVRSKCKEVATHPESPLAGATLECFDCGGRNVFLLGFIPSQTQTGVMILLCREPCLGSEALRAQGWDNSLWQPIIADRAFLPFVVAQPTFEDEAHARPLTARQISDVEMVWRKRPEATVDEALSAGVGADGDEAGAAGGAGAAEPAAAPVLLRYEDGYEFQNIFGPLVKLEADESKLQTQSLRQEGVSVRWEVKADGGSGSETPPLAVAVATSAGVSDRRNARAVAADAASAPTRGKRMLAHFRFARMDGSDLRLVLGDEMRLSLPSLMTQLGLGSLITAAVAGAEAKAAAAAAVAAGDSTAAAGASAALNGCGANGASPPEPAASRRLTPCSLCRRCTPLMV